MTQLSALETQISFLWLEITTKCNLECIHCYSNSNSKHSLLGRMRTEDWLNVISEAAACGCRHVQFIGGEPTLHPGLKEMILFAVTRGYKLIEVFTNATTIDDYLLEIFIKHKVQVATSFYSDQAPVHDLITGHQGSFERTVSSIKKLVALQIPVRVGIIEVPSNVGHAGMAKAFLERLGVFDIRIDIQRAVGRSQKIVTLHNPVSELCGECTNGKLCVTASGKVYPCVFARFAILGDINDGVANLLKSDPLAEFRTTLQTYREQKGKRGNIHHLSDQQSEICGPDVICNPDLQCSPNCVPGSSKCVPAAPPTPPCVPLRRVQNRHV